MSSYQNSYGQGAASYGGPSEPLAFFGGPSSSSNSPYYAGSRSSLEGNMGGSSGGNYATGSMASSARLGSMMAGEGRWWEAFTATGFEGEPSLMEGMWLSRVDSSWPC